MRHVGITTRPQADSKGLWEVHIHLEAEVDRVILRLVSELEMNVFEELQ